MPRLHEYKATGHVTLNFEIVVPATDDMQARERIAWYFANALRAPYTVHFPYANGDQEVFVKIIEPEAEIDHIERDDL